ncbi:MAG: hypothetical protein IJ867_07265 [Clostridia bacterium]|nr:hypothetical protein [Clostridia bacterium]
MKLLGILLILIVSFAGLALLVHICSKNNYALEYSSDKRKLKLYPSKDKASPKNKQESHS